MQNMKRLLSLLCLAAMVLSLAACGGSDGSGSDGDYAQVVYAYATFNNVPTTEDLAPVPRP